MHDLRLYGKNEVQIDSQGETINLFSKDIGIEFCIKKCGVLILKREKTAEYNEVVLPNGEVMKVIEHDGYKYLGI